MQFIRNTSKTSGMREIGNKDMEKPIPEESWYSRLIVDKTDLKAKIIICIKNYQKKIVKGRIKLLSKSVCIL